MKGSENAVKQDQKDLPFPLHPKDYEQVRVQMQNPGTLMSVACYRRLIHDTNGSSGGCSQLPSCRCLKMHGAGGRLRITCAQLLG